MAHIGKYNTLGIVRESAPGLYLDGGMHGEILLPMKYARDEMYIGGEVEVFVYNDSEDRLVATTERPYAQVDEFATLKVLEYRQGTGAFLDWGLSKDLLLPLGEQKGHLSPGDRVVVHVALDTRSDRVFASMRLNRYLSEVPPRYQDDAEVDLLIVNETPLGYNALVDNAYRGLLYHGELNATLEVGAKMTGYVKQVRPDGKIDLKLDASGYDRISPLTGQILEKLQSAGGRLELDDSSAPETIRFHFGVSKKAFKQAVGALLRERKIRFVEGGIVLEKPGSR